MLNSKLYVLWIVGVAYFCIVYMSKYSLFYKKKKKLYNWVLIITFEFEF